MTEHPGVLTIDVVVPSYRRPLLLERCLAALAAQDRRPDRVIVVARDEDRPSHLVVERFADQLTGLERATVREPGVLAAMAVGVAASTGDVIAFTDDDAAPRADWVEHLLRYFEDATVGAVGGRDLIPGQEQPLSEDVGRFRRSGRLTGLHHLGVGPPREVDVLKGVNMAFRAEALALPAERVLRGTGAQVDFEIIVCAWAKRRGWRLLYDPSVQVDHEGAARHGSDRRERPDSTAVFDAAFNSVVAASSLGAGSLARHTAYGLAVGTRDRPGVGRTVAALWRGEREVIRRTVPSLAGRLVAVARVLGVAGRSPAVVTARALREGAHRRPRIALVAHDIHDGGGMERAYAELIRRLAGDVDFVVVSARLAADLRRAVDWKRVLVVQRPFVAKFFSFWLVASLRLVRAGPIDLVQTLGAIVPNRADVATLQFCHAGYRAVVGGLAPMSAPPVRRVNTTAARALALLAEKWCYRPSRLRCFAAVSPGVANEAKHHYPGIPSVTIPNGVDVEHFAPDEADRASLRRDMGVADDDVIALFVGGDWDRKGLAIAIEATAKARAEGANVVLWVVGSGDQGRFGALAAILGAGDAVRFFGRRPDSERFYRGADVFVFPTAYEAFSLAMLEAAASGLPLVVPDVNGAAELVGDGGGGIVVERSADAVAAAVVALAVDPVRRANLGSGARRRAADFTWSRAADATVSLYAQLVGEVAR